MLGTGSLAALTCFEREVGKVVTLLYLAEVIIQHSLIWMTEEAKRG